MSYAEQRVMSDLYLDSFKDILKRNSMHFLRFDVSTEEEDTQQATDMVIKVEGGDVALRVREPSCVYRDLTIRTKSRYGGKTEIHKLREGFGTWYLYGWGDGVGAVKEYILVDLNMVRDFELLDKPRSERSNYDGTKFMSIPISELQMHGCIIAKQLSSDTELKVKNEIKNTLSRAVK